ncbi:hypothetical protein K3553_05105 [Leisingera aquaemixtae]|uniref:hypothetical protein n=1 Tax=Leisingera aquaemixtae TaxID=1396826 RepID=UPI0021A9516A|nr:hypothetical protein [Leisingera aquaemixtae]UWQ25844.1 hypothetical protein K3553_05105 [Leisingera aquaemixtae]
MTDPVSTVTLGAVTAYLAKDGIQKLLGPTADYLGDNLQGFVKKRHENLKNIFEKAEENLGDDIELDGAVPPKVLKVIVNDGSYSDDHLSQAYFAGVLASSRSPVGRDDRGARLARLVDSLSSYLVRAHYIFYHSFFNTIQGEKLNLFDGGELQRRNIFIPLNGFLAAMDFSDEEMNDLSEMVGHILYGLAKEGLIQERMYFGNAEHLEKQHPNNKTVNFDKGGVIFSPSTFGIELFSWGLGKGQIGISNLLKSEKAAPLLETRLLEKLQPKKI